MGVGDGAGRLSGFQVSPQPPEGARVSLPCSAQPLLKQPRATATYLFLNMERWGEVTGGSICGTPKASVS